MLKKYSYNGVQVSAHTKKQACRKAVAAARVAEIREKTKSRNPSKKFVTTASAESSKLAVKLVSEMTGGSEALIKALAPKVDDILTDKFDCYGNEVKLCIYRDRSDELEASTVNELASEEEYWDKMMSYWYEEAGTRPFLEAAEEIHELLREHWESELSGVESEDDVRYFLQDNIETEFPDFLHDTYIASIGLKNPRKWFEKLMGMSVQEIASKASEAAKAHPDDLDEAAKASGLELDLYNAVLEHVDGYDYGDANKKLATMELPEVVEAVDVIAGDIVINGGATLEAILDAKGDDQHKFGRNITIKAGTDILHWDNSYLFRSAADVTIPDSEFDYAEAESQGGKSEIHLA